MAGTLTQIQQYMKKKKQTNKRNIPERPGTRSLKLQPKHRGNTSIVPELILCGKWLEELGFKKESRVTLHTSKELIVIRPEESTG